jgi:hypothetical protein
MKIKNADSQADFKSVEKLEKMHTQKQNLHFFTFAHVRHICIAYNLSLVNLKKTFLGI